MTNVQPNLEIIKTEIYRIINDSNDIDFALLLENLDGKLRGYHPRRRNEFLKKLNEFLDRLDIRAVSLLIRIVKDRGGRLPTWITNAQFVIDYNGRGHLDLIRL